MNRHGISSSVLLLILSLVDSKKSFLKDSGLDFKFPPDIKPTPSGVPIGHLRPLGWQRQPDGEIEQLDKQLTPEEFYEQFGKQEKPLVFRQLLNKKNTPAISKWSDEYLKKTFGDLDLPVTEVKEDDEAVLKKMKFSQFLEDYEHEAWYIHTDMPKSMMADLILPQCVQCGTFSRYLTEAEFWMSSGGTPSYLHYHADDHLHCLVDGRKDFILIEKQYRDKLMFSEKMEHSGEGHSSLDPEMVNMFKFKELADIPWIYSILRKGDCLYIPSSYLHQVRSYGRSISSVVQWAATREVDFMDCEAWTLSDDVTLAKTSFMWTNDNGNVHLSNKHLTAETLRHHLLALLRKGDILHNKRFSYFYTKAMKQVKKKPPSKEVFRHFDVDKTGVLTRSDIKKLGKDVLDRVAIILNTAHPQSRLKDEL